MTQFLNFAYHYFPMQEIIIKNINLFIFNTIFFFPIINHNFNKDSDYYIFFSIFYEQRKLILKISSMNP